MVFFGPMSCILGVYISQQRNQALSIEKKRNGIVFPQQQSLATNYSNLYVYPFQFFYLVTNAHSKVSFLGHVGCVDMTHEKFCIAALDVVLTRVFFQLMLLPLPQLPVFVNLSFYFSFINIRTS